MGVFDNSCCSVPQLNTLRVTWYVHPHLDTLCIQCKYVPVGTLHRVRGLRAQPFSNTLSCTDVGSRTLSSEGLSPFPKNVQDLLIINVRSLPWLKIIPIQDMTTFYCSLSRQCSTFY